MTKPRRFQFERRVINPILNLIKKHQVFLTQEENIPQLAKLGFMYNTLWYAGRLCYGFDGLIASSYDCEDNPKYKIEMCDPETDEIENLIYDAWGMHISRDDSEIIEFDKFKNTIISNDKVYSEIELLLLKRNKTMEEWIEIKTHPDYRYRNLYRNRKSILDYLLCTIGIGYGLENGYIIEEASGADMDQARYGAWENAVLDERFTKTVNRILSFAEVKEVLDINARMQRKWNIQKELRYLYYDEKKVAELSADLDQHSNDKLDEIYKVIKEIVNKRWTRIDEEEDDEEEVIREEKYRPYYPISNYSIISQLDENSHPSYIKAGLEVCRDILANKAGEMEKQGHGRSNIEFAEKFIERFKGEQYETISR